MVFTRGSISYISHINSFQVKTQKIYVSTCEKIECIFGGLVFEKLIANIVNFYKYTMWHKNLSSIFYIFYFSVLFFGVLNNAYSVEIFSDDANYNTKSHTVKFRGNVKVLFENAQMFSNNLDVNLHKDEKMNIDSATAYGELKILNSSESATARRAVYHGSAKFVVLKDDVIIKRDGIEIKADQYQFNLKDKSSTLNANPNGRVKIKIENLEGIDAQREVEKQ